MITDDILERLGDIKSLLSKIAGRLGASSEDMIIQFPTSSSEMLVPAGEMITPVTRRINQKLRFITVSIPANGIMEIYNNNVLLIRFSDESGTIQLPNGITINDLVITLNNAGTEPARFNYRLVFGE